LGNSFEDMRRHVVDSNKTASVLLVADEVEAVIDPSEYPLMLRPPRSPHDPVWEFIRPLRQSYRLYLAEESAELADDVCALEIPGQTLEMANAVAARAGGVLAHSLLSALT
jgi:hypothetical protein